MKVIYIAGPYRAATRKSIEENIRQARILAALVWEAGGAALCPHMTTAHLEEDVDPDLAPDEAFLVGTMEMMRRCDAVYLVPGWQQSEGSRTEVKEARRLGMPVFESYLDMSRWIEG